MGAGSLPAQVRLSGMVLAVGSPAWHNTAPDSSSERAIECRVRVLALLLRLSTCISSSMGLGTRC